ncbi:MAG: hypothetical protein ORN83_13165 [Chthoniobacteraceae bacterium]|nr:hypothetical protein [Chthoniobacteraceae bacterium]
MTDISISEDKLVIEIKGWHKLWAFKSRLEVPLQNIIDSRPATSERVRGFRFPGTCIPSVITAGSYYGKEGWVFWDVCDLKRAIVLNLRANRYSKLVLEVQNPEESLTLIHQSLQSQST